MAPGGALGRGMAGMSAIGTPEPRHGATLVRVGGRWIGQMARRQSPPATNARCSGHPEPRLHRHAPPARAEPRQAVLPTSTDRPGRATSIGPPNSRRAAASAATGSVPGVRCVSTSRRTSASAAWRPASRALDSEPTTSSGTVVAEGRLGQQEVGLVCQADELGRWAAVAGVDEHASGRGNAEPRVRPQVRQERCLDLEWADREAVPGRERVERDGANEPLRAVERQDGVQRAGLRPHREGPERDGRQDLGAKQWIEVGAVVGVPMADEHGVERRRALGGQGGGNAVARIDQQAESVVLDEVATARLARTGVGATSPDDGELHPRRIGNQGGYGAVRRRAGVSLSDLLTGARTECTGALAL